MSGPADAAPLQDWVGRSERANDVVPAHLAAGLAATLDHGDIAARPGDALPPLAHWLLLPPLARHSELGPDGHPRRGGFLPPVALPRRMWAGSRVAFHAPLRVGEVVTRESRIARVEAKQGRAGALVFVTVQHDFHGAAGLAVSDEHDIVYREAPAPGAPPAAAQQAPDDATFERSVVPDPVLLFRYSALTFNGHRIHYDRSYAIQVEGYPGLVVHGPLIATLLLDLLRRQQPGADVRRFAFRALRPLFDTHPFTLCGRPEAGHAGRFALWARDHEAQLAVQAEAELA
ncbi:MAG: MaoC family dehydratase N-terminal domain-containing protein [Rubrivivax sp.]|nr:MaoC family dehydratase N-terminal domain-containing protein [Rubrivivax sp.]